MTEEEIKAMQEALATATKKLESFENEKKKSDEKKLKDAEDWKKLEESKNQELEAERNKVASFQKKEDDSLRNEMVNSVLKELELSLTADGARKMIPIDEIPVVNGKVDKTIVKNLINKLKTDEATSFIFKSAKPDGKLPNQAHKPGSDKKVDVKDLSHKDIAKLLLGHK